MRRYRVTPPPAPNAADDWCGIWAPHLAHYWQPGIPVDLGSASRECPGIPIDSPTPKPVERSPYVVAKQWRPFNLKEKDRVVPLA